MEIIAHIKLNANDRDTTPKKNIIYKELELNLNII